MRFLAASLAGVLVSGSGPAAAERASQPALPISARAIVDAAAHAAESGTLARWAAPWEGRARRSRVDRQALLALAMVATHRYEMARAESLLVRAASLGDVPAPNDEVSRLARFGLARLTLLHGGYATADRALRALQDEARAAADTATWIEVLVQRAATVRRLQSALAAEPLLDSAQSLGAARYPRLAATLFCRRAAGAGVRGDLSAMRRAAEQGIAAARAVHSLRLEAACQFARATSFARASATDSLRGPIVTAAAQQRTSHDLLGLGATLQWQGYYLLSLGRHHEAGVALGEAWRVATTAHSAEVRAWTALSRAALARALNDGQTTRRWLVLADSLMDTIGDEEGRRAVLQMRAVAAFAAGDTTRGWRWAEELLARMRAAGDVTGIQSALLLRTREAIDARDATRARANLQALRDYAREAHLTGIEATHRILEGELALLDRRWGDADASFGGAMRRIHPTQHYFLYSVHLMRALARARGGDIDESVRDIREGELAYQRWRATLTDSLLRAYATQPGRGQRAYRTQLIALYATAGRVEEALQLAEAQQARRFREQLAEASGWAEGARALSVKAADEVRGRARREGSAADTVIDLATIRAAIPDSRTAMVEFVSGRGATPSHVFVVTAKAVRSASVASMDSVAPFIQRLLASMRGGQPGEAPARALGALLLDPLQPILDSLGTERLVVVADDALHLLPFDLVRLRDGRAAIERYEISTMPSMTVAAALWRRDAASDAGRGVVALGDPALTRGSGDDGTGDEGDGGAASAASNGAVDALPPLPGARREVAAIAALVPGASVRTGAAASEAFLKRAAPAAGVVHLAAHGATRAWDGRQASVQLAAGGGEDGRLYAGEVAALDLRGALVVLSACRTDAGDVVAGEGVTGLTSAFLRAGARAVVTTAWQLPDRAIVPLMERFYQRLAAGDPVGRALRAARLASLERGDPAALWGGLRLVGDAAAPARMR